MFVNRREILTGVEDGPQKIRIACGANPAYVERRYEVHTLLNGLWIGEGLVPGVVCGISFAPWAFCSKISEWLDKYLAIRL